MMSKTHLTVGVATALAVTTPTTVDGIFAAVMGGCIGGILCDIECKSTPDMRDALYGRIIAAGVCGTLLIADAIMGFGIWKSVLSQLGFLTIIGFLILLVVCIIGRCSEHRTFTHSLLYVVLVTLGCSLITEYMLIPVFAGGISHLVIDTFNKKPVPWLYPFKKKGICFNICYASKVGNAIFMWLGLVLTIILLVWRIMTMLTLST